MKRLVVAITGNTAAWAGRLFQRFRCVQSYLTGGFGISSTFRTKHSKSFDAGQRVLEWAVSPRPVRRCRREGNLWHGSRTAM